MKLLNTYLRGKSLTVCFTFPESYDMANIDDLNVSIGSKQFTGDDIDISGQVACVRLKSEDTYKFTGDYPIIISIDDKTRGVIPIPVGDIRFVTHRNSLNNASTNEQNDIVIALSITQTTIDVDSVLYDVMKGDKGDAGTIEVGAVTTGDAGTDVFVENVGTSSEAVLNFTIPRGDAGHTPYIGVNGNWFINGVDTGVQAEGDATEAWVAQNYLSKLDFVGELEPVRDKLAGIEDNANNYVHPATHPPEIIEQDANNRFVTDAEKSTWNGKQNNLGFTPENAANKTQTLTADGTGAKYPTVDAVNEGLALKADTVDVMQNKQSIATLESILSDVNVNQEAQVTTSGASPLSLPKNAANGGMSVKLEGLTAENLVLNGDFRNGTTGWTTSSENIIILSISDNDLIATGHRYGGSYINTTNLPNGIASGSVIYIKFRAKVATVFSSSAVRFYTGATRVTIPNSDITRNNEWFDLSLLYVIPNPTNNSYLQIISYCHSSTPLNEAVVSLDGDIGFKAINLTATFGAGNEPTKEQCDKLFANYFEGTANTIGIGRVRSVGVGGINPSSLYFNGGTLRSNGLVKDEIRKGANGYELVKRVGVGTFGSELIPNGFDLVDTDSDGLANGFSISSPERGVPSIVSGNGFVRAQRLDYASGASGITSIRVNSVLEPDSLYKFSFKYRSNFSFFLSDMDYGLGWDRFPINTGDASLIEGYIKTNTGYVNRRSLVFTSWLQEVGHWAEIGEITLKKVVTSYRPLDRYATMIGNNILYTIATPVITPIAHAGLLNSNPNGTVYFEPAVADAGVYDTKMDILLTDFPISAIESISKHEDGVFIPLNPASAIIAIDGLSFTHPDLANGDLVAFTYLHSLESTGRSMTLTYYDSRYVVKDTANTNVYKITPKITSGALTWELTLV